jgi:hypothetical protein
MADDVKRVLEDVRRFPEDRQRDAADCIVRTLGMDEAAFADIDRRWKEYAETPAFELPDGFFDALPERQKARLVPRNPFVEDGSLTAELAEAIRAAESAPADRQAFLTRLLSDMIEGDRWDVILSPELRADLQAAQQADTGSYLSLEEVERRLDRLP